MLASAAWTFFAASPGAISQGTYLEWSTILGVLAPLPCYLLGRNLADVAPSAVNLQANSGSTAWRIAAIASKVFACAIVVLPLILYLLQLPGPEVSLVTGGSGIALVLVCLFVIGLVPVYRRSLSRGTWWTFFSLNVFLAASIAMIFLPLAETYTLTLLLIVPPSANAFAFVLNRS
jgi:hypothetical protein